MVNPSEWILSGISGLTLIAVGISYGDARARLIRIEKELFNGVYVKKNEDDIRIYNTEKESEIVNKRLDNLESVITKKGRQ